MVENGVNNGPEPDLDPLCESFQYTGHPCWAGHIGPPLKPVRSGFNAYSVNNKIQGIR